MQIVANNPWATQNGYEAQRGDMWSVDLSNVTKGVKEFAGSYIQNFMDTACQAVVFPIDQTEAVKTVRGTLPVYMPGYDVPLEPFRMTFLMDRGTITETQIYRESYVYRALYYWRQLSRAGRGNLRSSNAPALTLVHGKLTFTEYRFDITLRHLYGNTSGSGSPLTSFSACTPLTLKRAWVSKIQEENVDYRNGNNVITLTADVYAEEIVPGAAS